MSSEIMINELEFDKCRNVDILLLYHTNLSKPKIYTYRYLTTISLKDLNLIEEYLTHMLIFNILTYYRQTLRFTEDGMVVNINLLLYLMISKNYLI